MSAPGAAAPARPPLGLLAGTNPVTRVVGLLLLTTPLLLSIDIVSALVSLGCTLLAAPLCGVGPVRLLRRGWPVLAAAPVTAISMALYGRPGGAEHFSLLLIRVTDNSLHLAAAILLRVLAIGLPVVVLTAGVDPAEVGAGLAQVLRLPARFVLAAVAGVRLIGLFLDDWHALGRARRARGLGDAGRLRRLLGQVFALLVLSLRRGTKLATAMEARGFGAPGPRTWFRRSTVGARDAALLVACAGIAAASIWTAVALGAFRPLGA
ncbi:energy-coupling factor transporter transmembrane component T family protein [Corynebacterium sphenisci]|uniref:energy-coupling factor transporter transmembrane component T family protein n=1 Tax=Corynebacterium sphenisci TaxID=191493 RepID=UPI0026E09DC3|nr:energy-coupling factor transporter transmembrane component T [Corynebacterium sphenisci]MDO5730630.1 energy-coupling factor transporter transmembrane component T [Corynebacterium sphenisci]